MEPQLPFWGTLTAPGDEGHNAEEQDYLIEEGYRMMDEFCLLYTSYELGEDAVLWSEYSPVIYELHLTIPGTDEESVTTFGLRDFSTSETEFLINGTPTFLRGKHDGLILSLIHI